VSRTILDNNHKINLNLPLPKYAFIITGLRYENQKIVKISIFEKIHSCLIMNKIVHILVNLGALKDWQDSGYFKINV